jgi:GH24 family phage-related lysozyme (muramidase)
MNRLRVVELATAIIKEFEGFRAQAYPDPRTGGEPITIGYGTTVYNAGGFTRYGRAKVKIGDVLTKGQAESELDIKVRGILDRLDQVIGPPLTDGQMACMVSFVYNVGMTGAERQIDRLNANKIPEFMVKHIEYINKGTIVEAGLRRRRTAELELFNMVDKPMKVTWINLVRHTVKEAPEYRAYLMAGSVCVEIRTWKTREELLAILRGTQAGNVAVGEEGWHVEPAVPAETVAVLTSKGFRRDKFLDLELDIGGEIFSVISGQADAQTLRKPEDPRSRPGNMEPIPQGTYKIGNIDWVNGKDNYAGSWGRGLGPVWIGLSATFSDDRGSFGIHQDLGYAGSAGCVVLPSVDELKRLVAALRKYDPKTLVVDWKL